MKCGDLIREGVEKSIGATKGSKLKTKRRNNMKEMKVRLTFTEEILGTAAWLVTFVVLITVVAAVLVM